MSNGTDPTDQQSHMPRHPGSVQTQGFGSDGKGRDIFFAAVEATRMPMAIADPRIHDVPLVFANEAFLEMTGYTLKELVGRNCRFLQGPETDRATVARLREAIRTEREVTVEILNYRKDGSSFWNALFLTPIRDQRGELVYFFSSQLNVSRRHDAESALKNWQNDFAKVAPKVQELRTAVSRAEQLLYEVTAVLSKHAVAEAINAEKP